MGQTGMDDSFMKLFRFISGGNEAKEKIAMTTPVLMSRDGGRETMSFILPERLNGAPKPDSDTVTLERMEPARFAVMRFDGRQTVANEAVGAAALRSWMEARGIPAGGHPLFAYFDPPWTPLFLRRNEVMIPIPMEQPY